jgi:hypothetical protein
LALGEVVSNLIITGGDILSLAFPSKSFIANLSADLSKDRELPEKGSIIVPNFGLVDVGNTRKTERQLKIQTTTLWLSLKVKSNFRSSKGIMVGNQCGPP